jgi:hypothetical protein
LSRPTGLITRLTGGFDLPNVPVHVFPAINLPTVFVAETSTKIVAAIPLEPTAWVIRIKPAFALPFFPTLAGVDFEIIE